MTNSVVMSIPIAQIIVWKNFFHEMKPRLFREMANFKSINRQNEQGSYWKQLEQSTWSQVEGDPTGQWWTIWASIRLRIVMDQNSSNMFKLMSIWY